jgi:hypothetical protein
MMPIVRFLYFYFSGDGGGHVQSLVLGGVLLMMGFVTFVFALIADLINFNRRLIEMTLQKVRALEFAAQTGTRRPPDYATAALPRDLREASVPRGEEARAPVLGRGA